MEACCDILELSGWITAFCVWNKDGTWVGPKLDELLKGGIDEPLRPPPKNSWEHPPRLVLDGRPFSFTNFDAIPPGYASVDVEVDDHGEISKCEMVAGHIGWHILAQDEVAWYSTLKEQPPSQMGLGEKKKEQPPYQVGLEEKKKKRGSKILSAGAKLIRSMSRADKTPVRTPDSMAYHIPATIDDTPFRISDFGISDMTADHIPRIDNTLVRTPDTTADHIPARINQASDELGFGDTIRPASAWFIYVKS